MSGCEAESPFIRAFVAVEVPLAVRRALVARQAFLRKAETHVAWVPLTNLHLSLAFLGDIPSIMVEMLALALDETAASNAPFVCVVKGLGTFGGSRAPRVVWAGLAPCPPLMRLQRELVGHLGGLGVDVESREYHPHITLGRIRSPRSADRLVKAADAAREDLLGEVPVESVALMRSRLCPAGAEYTLLHSAALRKASATA